MNTAHIAAEHRPGPWSAVFTIFALALVAVVLMRSLWPPDERLTREPTADRYAR